MNILITGSEGQMGIEFKKILNKATHKNTYFCKGHKELDITDYSSVYNFVIENKIDVIVNCAAYTNFDMCPSNITGAFLVNSFGPKILSDVIRNTDGVLIHISSDYVFSGNKNSGYYETYETPKPISVYGKSKFLGEKYIQESGCDYLIFRTSWLYGGDRKNFVKTMFSLIEKNDEIKVVCDQHGTPTYVVDLVNFLFKLIEENDLDVLKEKNGIYHFSNEGITTWYDIAKFVYDLRKKHDTYFTNMCIIKPVSTDEYPSNDNRPKYSPLSSTCLNVFNYKNRKWEDALEECVLKYIKEK